MKIDDVTKIVWGVLAGLNKGIKGPVMPEIVEGEDVPEEFMAIKGDAIFLMANPDADAKALYEERLIVNEVEEPVAFINLKEKEKLPLYITVAVVRSVQSIKVEEPKPEEEPKALDWSKNNLGDGGNLSEIQ
jgi:hypothetical protein